MVEQILFYVIVGAWGIFTGMEWTGMFDALKEGE